MVSKVMTANSLREGEVVYLTRGAGWTLWLAEAAVARDDETAAHFEVLADAAVADGAVVGPYLMDVAEEAGRPQPLSTRERLRALGPSVHLQFGKQAMASGAAVEGHC